MAKRYPITISEETEKFGFRVFNIVFAKSWLALKIAGAFDLKAFSQEGYLGKFILDFGPKDLVCYLFFSAFSGMHGVAVDKIDQVLSLSSGYICLGPIKQEKLQKIQVPLVYPNQIYFLSPKGDISSGAKEIFNILYSMDTRLSFIFAAAKDKEALFSQVKQLHASKTLGEDNLLSLNSEMVSLRYGKYGIEEEFRVFTRRFDGVQIRKMFLSYVDTERFEVILK